MKIALHICIIVVTVLVSVLCYAEKKELVTVGVTIPLSGGFVEWGDSIRRGIEIYAAEPDNRFKFNFQDETIGDAKLALAAYRKFRSDGTQYVVMGTMIGTKAVLPIAKNDPVLLLSIGLVDEEELEQSSKLVSLATQLATESDYLGNYIFRSGFRRIAIIHRIDPFSEEFARTLNRTIEGRGAQVVSKQGVDPREADFRPLLLRLKATNPDALCFNLTQDREVELVKQVKELGLQVALFSNYDFETASALQQEKLVSDVRYSFPRNSADGSEEKAEFDRKFKERFGEDAIPGANSYFIYDGLKILNQALQGCAAENVDCVNRYFRNLKQFDGIAGKVAFQPDGSNIRPYGMKTIRDGKFVWLEDG